jgi:antirestriction protein ArdC
MAMKTQNEIRAELTNRIVAALKQGVIPWRKPWRSIPDPVRLPTNFVTKKAYQGFNILNLQLAAQLAGYPASLWASYNQFRSVGAQVRRGEKATQIILFKPVTKIEKGEDGKDDKTKTFPILKTWSVFNIAQVDGEIAEKYQVTTAPTGTRFEDVDRAEFDQAVAATGADIRFGGNKAAYHRPPGDFIIVPHEEQFHDFPAFAETVLHEITHWSEWRTGWSGNYAEGELRAEIGACFLATALGIPNSSDLTNHTSYIASWLQALENDPKFIFRASAVASQAADFILGFSRPKTEEEAGELVEAA